VKILSYKIKHRNGAFFIRLGPDKYSYLKYIIKNRNFEITSTFTPEDYRGKRLAAALVEKAVNFANEKNLHVIPKCNYAKDYLSKKNIKK
jgi:predicted GNAT family acetyltransferase